MTSRWIPALLILSGMAIAQDAATQAREWCDKLGEENPQIREEAQRQLIRLGSAALPALKETAEKSSDPEIRDRARKAMEEIARGEKLEKVYQAPKHLTVDFKEVPLREVVADLSRRTGLRFTVAQMDTPITMKFTDAPLLQVLDEISRQLKESSLKFVDEKTVALNSDRFIPYPTTYSGAFRLRVTRIEKQISNTFDKVSGEVRVCLMVDWEKTVKPLDNYQIDLLEASDDQNHKLTVQERADENGPIQFKGGFRRIGGAQPAPTQEIWLTFPDVEPSAKALRKLRARGTFRFPLDVQPISFTDPVAGAEKTAGDYTIKIQSIDRNYVMINVHCKTEQAAQNLSETFDFGSFEIVDKSGNVNKTEVASSGILDQRTYQFYAMTRRAAVKEFRFSLREIVSKTVDFELDELSLPQ
jgi:hypothetical protein